jgi:hypothetical protein
MPEFGPTTLPLFRANMAWYWSTSLVRLGFFCVICWQGLIHFSTLWLECSLFFIVQFSLYVCSTPGRSARCQIKTTKTDFATTVPVTLAVLQACISGEDLGLMIFRSDTAGPLQRSRFYDVTTSENIVTVQNGWTNRHLPVTEKEQTIIYLFKRWTEQPAANYKGSTNINNYSNNRSRYSDWLLAGRPRGRSSNPGGGKILFSPRRPDWFWGPHSLPSNG